MTAKRRSNERRRYDAAKQSGVQTVALFDLPFAVVPGVVSIFQKTGAIRRQSDKPQTDIPISRATIGDSSGKRVERATAGAPSADAPENTALQRRLPGFGQRLRNGIGPVGAAATVVNRRRVRAYCAKTSGVYCG